VIEIANGVDIEVFSPTSSNIPLPAYEEKFRKFILFVGNLMPVKRLDVLLRALKLITNQSVLLKIIGGGYEEERYKKMAIDLGVQDRVEFLGACHDKQKLVEYYNTAWCVAIPSVSESFSLVALESMACGCPVIARNITGVSGRISHGVDGWLVDNDEPKVWAKKLNDILNLSDDERNKMGEAGRQKILQYYSWDEHMKKLEEVYTRLIGGRTIKQ
jgi:D-inositol-3-phosphate glycosyltransferase